MILSYDPKLTGIVGQYSTRVAVIGLDLRRFIMAISSDDEHYAVKYC